MEAYTGFAYVYDEYMDNIPYDEWSEYLIELLKENRERTVYRRTWMWNRNSYENT